MVAPRSASSASADPATRQILETVAGGVPAARRLVLRISKALRRASRSGACRMASRSAKLYRRRPGGTPRPWRSRDKDAVVRALHGIEGCRAADPGEFTRRAFLNGRIDLGSGGGSGRPDRRGDRSTAQAGPAPARGRPRPKVERWREELLRILARPRSGARLFRRRDVPDDTEHKVRLRIGAVRQAIGDLLDRPSGERLREGFTVVLAGPPNAGKSTLLNAVAKRDVAIVLSICRTTRDIDRGALRSRRAPSHVRRHCGPARQCSSGRAGRRVASAGAGAKC